MIITNFIFYNITADNVRTQKISDLSHALDKSKDTYRKAIESIVEISSVLYTDSDLSAALDTNYSTTNEVLIAYDTILNSSVNQFVSINKQFYNAYLYTNNKTLIGAGVLKSIDKQTEKKEWYNRIRNQSVIGELHLHTNKNFEHPEQSYLSIIRKLDYFRKSGSYMKILKVDILPQFVKETLEDNSSIGDLYLINDKGDILYSSQEKYIDLMDQMDSDKNLVLTSTFDKVSYLQGWKMIGIYPKDQIDSAMRHSRLFFIYLMLANLLLPSLIIIVLSSSLNSRIVVLWKQMKQVKNQRYDLLNVDQAKDEIGQLTEEFNRLTSQISMLIRDVYEAELGRKQAQLNALQSQINPHFLFNTLETIRMNSMVKNEHDTALVISRLARSIRRSITWGNDFVPISEEMEIIVDFLEIQKFRFEHRLRYEFHIEDAIKDVSIPKMSILPIVENACIHGIERSADVGLVRITGNLDNGMVKIEITDNGIGMSDEELEDIVEAMRGDVLNQGNHIGIRNVYNRLKLYYNDGFDLAYRSEPGRGTSVTMLIPANTIVESKAESRDTHV
jgi:two-component system sensor histidine kinase YesM